MRVRNRLERLEKILPPPPPPTPDEREVRRRWGAVCDRLFPPMNQSFPLESEPEYALAEAAFGEWINHGRGPVAQWMDDLREGRWRVPEMSAETLRQLVLCWLHPDRGDALVCNRCGLECPRSPDRNVGRRCDADREKLADLAQKGKWPRYFEACPCCGADKRDADWPHLVAGKNPPWKALDGWMGYRGKRP
jgi:hypothetical protein